MTAIVIYFQELVRTTLMGQNKVTKGNTAVLKQKNQSRVGDRELWCCELLPKIRGVQHSGKL